MNKSVLCSNLKQNWKSGLTVALVALPLSLSLGVAAGATPLMGVITAIWAGLIAALFGGSNYNVVGPTGALSGILATYALLHGAASLPILAILSGAIILIFYALRWERYIVFIPASVVHGFTLGVAFIIALNQLNFALGLKGLPVHERFFDNVIESFSHIGQADMTTFILFAVALGVIVALKKYVPRIPGVIAVATAGIALGYAAQRGMVSLQVQTIASKFGAIPNSIASMPQFSLDAFGRETAIAALTIAVVAILETLISAKIADGMTKTKSDQRKEVFGLGLANVASGLFGGIPATAALARTSLNIKSGATHKTSAGIAAIGVVVIALVLLSGFQFLPLAFVAAILVSVALFMVEREQFVHLYHFDKKVFSLSMITAAITIVEDPIVGILFGSVIALLMFVNTLSWAQGEITINKGGSLVGRYRSDELEALEDHGDVLVYRFAGQLTYINAQGHLQALAQINDETKTVVLSFRNLFYIDIDGIDAVAEMIELLEQNGKTVYLSSVNHLIGALVKRSSWYVSLRDAGRIFDSASHALQRLHSGSSQ
jgi:SulP family sulfate permease